MQNESIVAFQSVHCIEMVIGVLGILKAGAAYLPVDPDYPEERTQFMLRDSNAVLMLNQGHDPENSVLFGSTGYKIPPAGISGEETYRSSQPAYIIYTSGSTGRPKGVVVEHRSLVNLVSWHNKTFSVQSFDRATKYAGFGFDASVWEMFPYLVSGAVICMVPDETRNDAKALVEYFEKDVVTIGFLPTQMCEQFIAYENQPSSLRILLTGGDRLHRYSSVPYRLINNYGPTENTVVATSIEISSNEIKIPIGRPITNNRVYILGRHYNLQPVGIPGELCIAGSGVTRGYLNRPELTSEKFIPLANIPQLTRDKSNKDSVIENSAQFRPSLYRTGDSSRWLTDGIIQFLGRIDRQVKIRGYRIEPDEIENQLMTHENIREAVVIIKEREVTDRHLCVYFVAGDPALFTESSYTDELSQYLARKLPYYMIPSFFYRLDQFPLTPGGKVDRKALLNLDVKGHVEQISPGTVIQEKLAGIWADVLGTQFDSIGIDSGFMELGGHSLNATVVIARIHKELGVEIPLAEFFNSSSVRELEIFITQRHSGDELIQYQTISPAEQRDYFPLSSAQKRLYILQRMNPDSTAYNSSQGMVLEGEPDIPRIEELFKKLILRHESFRTSFVSIGEEPVQRIHDNVEWRLERDSNKMSSFIRPFDLSQPPCLRIGLFETAENSHVMLVDMHHIITDGISHNILVREFLTLYDGKELPGLRLQYKDFSHWQNSESEKQKLSKKRDFWLNRFQGEIPRLTLPYDYQRPRMQLFEGDIIRFELGEEETLGLTKLAAHEGATLFMILLGVFNLLLFKLSGQEDIVVGTGVAGRRHNDLEKYHRDFR